MLGVCEKETRKFRHSFFLFSNRLEAHEQLKTGQVQITIIKQDKDIVTIMIIYIVEMSIVYLLSSIFVTTG